MNSTPISSKPQQGYKQEGRETHGSYYRGNRGSKHVESNGSGMRARNGRGATGHRYGNHIGRIGVSDSDNESISTQNESNEGLGTSHRSSRSSRRERQLPKRKLKQKGNVPGHVAWTKWMNSDTKNHTVAMIGEFIGTTLFLFFAFGGTQTANIGAGQTQNNTTTGATTGFNPSTLLYISLSFGFSLMVNAWIFFRISGGLFNPAVTLALTLTRDLHPFRAVLLLVSQLGGACFAAYLVKVMFPSPFNVATSLGSGTTTAQGVWIEALCTAELVFTIIMLAKEKHRATFIAPIGIGLSLFIAELVAVYYTGGSLNPARSFGPAAVGHDFLTSQWIYWVGPFIGSILAVLFYYLMKILEYEMANPGQDGDIENDPTQNPDHEIAAVVEERQAEVEEIQAIEEEGSLQNLTEKQCVNAEGSVLNADCVIDVNANDVGQDDESRLSEVRTGEPDLEAQWHTSHISEGVGSERELQAP